MQPTAFITGITGQDGSYLAEFLLSRGYSVHGLIRRNGKELTSRIDHIVSEVTLHEGDLQDENRLAALIGRIRPREIYNLAADTFVPASWETPVESADTTALGVMRMLEATRSCAPKARFLQASTSEMFGDARTSPQNEQTEFYPRNPYAASKVYGHWLTVNYREHYRMFATSAILFNHESPRRAEPFVSRKITRAAARIKLGLQAELRLGNLQARRDWGYAGDYVRAMWLMLQQDRPEDFVIGTGVARRVEEFVAAAFDYVGLDWNDYVVVDPRFYRPAEANVLVADASRACERLAWKPETSFDQLVAMMVDADLTEQALMLNQPTARIAAV